MEKEFCRQGEHRGQDGAQVSVPRSHRVCSIDPVRGEETVTTVMCERHAHMVAKRYRREGREGVRVVAPEYLEELLLRRAEREQMGANPYPRPTKAAPTVAERTEADRAMTVTSGMVEAFLRVADVVPGGTEKVRRDVVLTGLTVALFSRYLEEKATPELHPVNRDPYPGTVAEVADEFVRAVTELEESGAATNLVEEVRKRLRQYAWKHSDDPCGTCARPRNGVSKGCAECQHRHPEMYAKAYPGEPGPAEPEARAEAVADWRRSNAPEGWIG